MQSRNLIAILFIASCALSTGARGQNVYKCGDVYSQMPCPGSQVFDATDARTLAQKKQTDLAISRDARLADAMEQARLAQEEKDLAANRPVVNPSKQAAGAKTPKSVAIKPVKVKREKQKEPGHSLVPLAGEKMKKSPLTKNASKKHANRT